MPASKGPRRAINHKDVFARLWNRSMFWVWSTDRNTAGQVFMNHEDPTFGGKPLDDGLYMAMMKAPIRWEFCIRALFSNGSEFWVRDQTLEIQQQMRLVETEKFYEEHLPELLASEQIRQVVDTGWIARPVARTAHLAALNASRPMDLLHLANLEDKSRQWYWRKLHANKPWMPAALRKEIEEAA